VGIKIGIQLSSITSRQLLLYASLEVAGWLQFAHQCSQYPIQYDAGVLLMQATLFFFITFCIWINSSDSYRIVRNYQFLHFTPYAFYV